MSRVQEESAVEEIDFVTSKAFVKRVDIPPTGGGVLDNSTFAVKDLIDIGGEVTGCGNPSWAERRPKAAVHAPCVEQLLSSGARCVGKTITDELAYGMIGENHFYGTPLNPKAPDRVPGGSSSGSASAVACSVVDFALGTDTGGSVRVPASNCGILGFRPTHGRISVAGVNPFAPTFDTVGIFTSTFSLMRKVSSVLLPSTADGGERGKKPFLLDDFVELCSDEMKERYRALPWERITLRKLLGAPVDYRELWRHYITIQCAEIWSSLGSWIESENPLFGPVTHASFHCIAKVSDRTAFQASVAARESFALAINSFTKNEGLLAFPTTPAIAPLLGTIGKDVEARRKGEYYPRLLAMGSLSCFSRAPQISIPFGTSNGAPIALSLLGEYGSDGALIDAAEELSHRFA